MLIVRLFVIQVVKDTYRLSADNNVLRYVTQYPARGLIYDRNKKLMVYNQAAYDLMVVPAQVTKIDTSEFCNLLEISTTSFRERMRRCCQLFKTCSFSVSEADLGRIICKTSGEIVSVSRLLCSAQNFAKIFKTNCRAYSRVCQRG